MAASSVSEGPKLFQGVARNDFAFKLLKQMGWEEGMGLGKEKQGIKTHIRVRKNVEQSGVGLAEAKKQAADWTINTSIYDRILANLTVKSAGERTSGAEQNDSESEDAEKVVKKSKKQKVDGEGEEVGRKSKKRKSVKEEVKELEAEEKQPRKLARHVGRYKKREASKAVAGYASHHLQEILGGQPSSLKVELPVADMGATRVTITEEETEDTVVVKKMKKKSRDSKENSPSEDQILSVKNETATEKIETAVGTNTSVTVVTTSTTAVTASTAGVGGGADAASRSLAESPDWWGHKYGFVRGGGLGEKQKKKETGDEAKRGFLEQDQEDLYNLVQDKKTSGKQGLGIGSQPKKVAGARWKGSKVNFDDDNGSEEGIAEAPSAANDKAPAVTSYNDVLEAVRGARDEDLVGNGNILSIEDKTRRADAKDREFRKEGAGAGANEGEQAGVGAIKWKKLLMKELEEVGLKGIKLSKLRKRLAAAALAKPGFGGLDKGEVKRTAEDKIRTSSKCIINGDRVFPATGVALPLKHKA